LDLEKKMNTHYLSSLFKPESVVLFGASDKQDSVGGVVFKNLLTSGFEGRIFAINPKRDEVQGQKAFSSLEEIDEVVDLAVVATPAKSIPGIVEECGEHGVKMMLILSAGFRETGAEGRRLEDQSASFVRIGASTLPLATTMHSRAVWPSYLNPAQSVLRYLIGRRKTRLVSRPLFPRASPLTSTSAITWISWSRTRQPKPSCYTSNILLYIEGINDSRRFMSSLRAAARIKPVIALKVGRHAAGAEASMSHTGALVGSDEVFAAALSRSGVLRVETVGQLFSAAKALSSTNYRGQSERLVIITNGGGPGVMAADRATDHDIELSSLSAETMAALDEVLPSVWSHGNPVDIIGDAPPDRYEQALDICLKDPGVDGAIVILTPQAMTEPTAVAEAVLKSAAKTGKPIMTSWMGGKQVEGARRLFSDAHLPDFRTLEHAVDAFSYLARYNKNQRLLLQTPGGLPRGHEVPDREGARLIIEAVLTEQRRVLTEPESMAVLNAFRIPTVRNGIARSGNESLVIAESIGFPIAMKVLSTDISHKSDVGGVRLNINSAQEVRGAYRQLIDDVKRHVPDADVSAVTIEKMYRSPNGRELMIGVIRDPVFGPVISFGSGGTTVEVMGDSAVSLPPLNRRLAIDLINRTKVSKMLGKFRQMPAVDIDQLVSVLLNVSAMACELPWLQEMDINPLIIDENGLVAVDARIVVDYPTPSTDRYHHLAIHPYPTHFVKKIQLNDGTDITIRPIRPEDAEMEAKFVRELSNEAKYFRFMNSFHELSQEMLVRFTQIDYHNEMALIAVKTDSQGEEQIGVARYSTNVDKTSCEFALVVSDKWQSRGIAHHLMKDLMEIARDRNLETMEGQVLRENSKMLELVASLGFQVRNDAEDNTIKQVEARLQ
jgi:acetyltransferase